MKPFLWQDWSEIQPLKNSEENAIIGDVVGNKEDSAVATVSEVASLMAYVKSLINNSGTLDDSLGAMVSGRAITATLLVSPNGNGVDGLTWDTAYTTIQGALDVASTDANECTLIVISPNATFYDIDTTGDPTWTGNYELIGTHRIWAAIKNTHADATSVFKFTGKASLYNLAISTQGVVGGVVFTGNGSRVRKCGFNSEALTGDATSIHLDGTAVANMASILEDIQFRGNKLYTKAVHVDDSKVNEIGHLHIHSCLTAIHIEDSDSSGENSIDNTFENIDIGDCTLGIDLDGGCNQHFESISFHDNTENIDDEVGDSHWNNIIGEFAITNEPDNFTGIAVDTGDGADTWTAADVEVRAAATSTVPFRIVGVNMEAGTGEKYRLRLTADGTNYFDDFQFEGDVSGSKTQALSFPGGTDYVFNAGTQIKASSKSESAGVDTLVIWLKIQEI